ncbi:tyrosine-type recombinase/integrase [Paraburkholderia sp. J69-1]|nr:tyrosine-type recombinase/integrase [Paraburkholderia sp. J69-1]
MLLTGGPVIQFWNAGRVQTLLESDAPTIEVVVSRLLRTLRMRFRFDGDKTPPPAENQTTSLTPRHRGRIATSLEDEVWLNGAGPMMNHNATTNSLGVQDDAAAVTLFLRDRTAASAHTRRAYVEEILRFIRWCEQCDISGPLSTLSRQEFIAYREHLAGVALQTGELPLGASAQKRALAVMRSLFSFLWKTGYLVSNVVAGLSSGSHTRTGFSVDRILPDAAVRAIDRWLRDHLSESGQAPAVARRAAIVALYRFTGVRLDELPWRDGYPRVVAGDEGWTLLVRGKGQRLREIPLPSTCVAFLRQYRVSLGLPVVPQANETGPLIHGQRKDTLGASGMYRQVRAAFVEIAGSLPETEVSARLALERASPHWMRHLVGRTLVVDASVPLPIAQLVLGHASVETTATYARADISRVRQSMQLAFSPAAINDKPDHS